MTWISDFSGQIAQSTGIEPAALALTEAEIDTLLRLAGVAAHKSRERTNAPLLCHVLGRAVALGTPLDVLARLVDAALTESDSGDIDGAG
jgi:hypothetical protein